RLDTDRHQLSMCLSSLCGDAASLRLLIRELADLYAGRQLDGDPLQYADLADWQNQLLEDKSQGEAGHAYWRQHDIGGASAALPFESAPREGAPFHTITYSIQLPARVDAHLSDAAARREVTSSAALAATWQALLWRLTGAQDPLVWHV